MSWFRRRSQPDAPATPVAVRGTLELRRPWIRPSVKGQAEAGAFLIIDNKGMEQDRLLAADSAVADAIEVQAIRVVDGDICMQTQPQGLALPPGTTIELKPRGYHLLFKGLSTRLEPGVRVKATLAFERAGRVELEFAVETPGLVGDWILHEERKSG
jgi:periplasmic copper chaperone A